MSDLLPAFTLGLLATLSPCALPLYPGFLAYLAAGSRVGQPIRGVRWLGLVVLAGVLTAMLALGAIVAALGLALGSILAIVAPLADLVVVTLGLLLIVGAEPFARLPTLAARGGGGPVGSAFIYGLLYGPITLPCSGALVVSIFTLSLAVESFAQRLAFFLVFGLGLGLPLLLLSLVAQARSAALLGLFTRHHRTVSVVAGLVLLVVGGLDLFDKLPAIRLYLGA